MSTGEKEAPPYVGLIETALAINVPIGVDYLVVFLDLEDERPRITGSFLDQRAAGRVLALLGARLIAGEGIEA
jgi:hypothetical protein